MKNNYIHHVHISETVQHIVMIFGKLLSKDDISGRIFLIFFLNFDFLGCNGYIRYMPYLRNSIAYEHNYWYTCVK